MSISYENQRVHFDLIVRRYKDYVELYKEFNGGSAEGVTPFAEFYWRMTYDSRYEDPDYLTQGGY